MSGPFENWMSGPGFGPNWMHGPVGTAYWKVVGAMIDQQTSRMKAGMRARFPLEAAELGMSDALEELGKDRKLPRGGTYPGAEDQSDANYGLRLHGAWDAWAKGGTPLGLLRELSDLGFPTGATGTMIANHIGMAYTLDGSSNLVISKPFSACVNRTDLTEQVPSVKLHGFTLDARDWFYSHFAILFLQDIPTLDNSTGNPAKSILNAVVKRWRCGGAIYNGASVVPSGSKVWGWPTTMKWGDTGLKWGANGARFIDPE